MNIDEISADEARKNTKVFREENYKSFIIEMKKRWDDILEHIKKMSDEGYSEAKFFDLCDEHVIRLEKLGYNLVKIDDYWVLGSGFKNIYHVDWRDRRKNNKINFFKKIIKLLKGKAI